jgi:hypothetical protein
VTCGDVVCSGIWIFRRITRENLPAFRRKSARFQKEWGRYATKEYMDRMNREDEKEITNMRIEVGEDD